METDVEEVVIEADVDGSVTNSSSGQPAQGNPTSPQSMTIDEKSQDDEIQIVSFSLGGKVVSPKEFNERSKTTTTTFEGAITPSKLFVLNAVKNESSGLPDAVLPFIEGRQKRSENCDVVLISGPNKTPVHESVLAGYSPFFRRTFAARVKKTQSTENALMFRLTVDIPDSSVLNLLVKHMYNGGNAISLEEAKNLIPATTILEIDYLTDKCIKIITKDLKASNCLEVILLAATSKNKKLREMAETVMIDKLETILCSSTFMNLSLDMIIQLISKDTLTVSAEVINQIVDSWMSYHQRRSNIAIFTQLKTIQLFRGQDKYETSIFDGKPDDFKLETSESYTPGWVFLSSLITPKAARAAVSPISTNINQLGESIKVKMVDPGELPKSSDGGLEFRRKRKNPGGLDEPEPKKTAHEISLATMQSVYNPEKSVRSLPRIPKRTREGVTETQNEDWNINDKFKKIAAAGATENSWESLRPFDNDSQRDPRRGGGRNNFQNNNNPRFGRNSGSFGGSNNNLSSAADEDWDSTPATPNQGKPSVTSTPKTAVADDDWDTPASTTTSSWGGSQSGEKFNSWGNGSSFGNSQRGGRGGGGGRSTFQNNNNRFGGNSNNLSSAADEDWDSTPATPNQGKPSVTSTPKTAVADDDWDTPASTTTSSWGGSQSGEKSNSWGNGSSFGNSQRGGRGGGGGHGNFQNNNNRFGGSNSNVSAATAEDDWGSTPSQTKSVTSTPKTADADDDWGAATSTTTSSWGGSQSGGNSNNDNSWGNRSFDSNSRGGSRGGRGGGRGRGGGGGGDSSFAPRDGDWKCSGCGFSRNFASRSDCFKCHEPKPGGGGDGGGGDGGGGGSTNDDWGNTSTGSSSWGGSQSGRGRGGGRGGRDSSSLEGAWACPCGYRTNYASRSVCFKCKEPKPGGGDGGGSTNDDWGSTSTGSSWGGSQSNRGQRGGRGGGFQNRNSYGGTTHNVVVEEDDWDAPATHKTPVASVPKKIAEDDDWDAPATHKTPVASVPKKIAEDDDWDVPATHKTPVASVPKKITEDDDWDAPTNKAPVAPAPNAATVNDDDWV